MLKSTVRYLFCDERSGVAEGEAPQTSCCVISEVLWKHHLSPQRLHTTAVMLCTVLLGAGGTAILQEVLRCYATKIFSVLTQQWKR